MLWGATTQRRCSASPERAHIDGGQVAIQLTQEGIFFVRICVTERVWEDISTGSDGSGWANRTAGAAGRPAPSTGQLEKHLHAFYVSVLNIRT